MAKKKTDPVEILNDLGAKWSPDLDDWLDGRIAVPTCVLCGKKPCECPPFGTPEYFALVNKVHGR